MSATALAVAGCGGGSGNSRDIAYPLEPPHGGAPEHVAVAADGPQAHVAMSDRLAAKLVRHSHVELRPGNVMENHRMPTSTELAQFRAVATTSNPALVTGHYTGTTDEILQWAARKWGIPVDVVRAVAYVESRWRMSFVGDNGVSFGIMQVKYTYHLGTRPLSQKSTAFNVDYWGAVIRDYMDGASTWLNDVDHGQPYKAGDLWGAVGAWYAGRWHTPEAERYIASVKQAMRAKPWTKGF